LTIFVGEIIYDAAFCFIFVLSGSTPDQKMLLCRCGLNAARERHRIPNTA